MFGMKTLDVGIGMALMFLFVSLICSALREFGEALFKTRAASLERGLHEMFGGSTGGALTDELVTDFYEHPMITALYTGPYAQAKPVGWQKFVPGFARTELPSYIPSENFARTVLQLARQRAGYDSRPDVAVTNLRIWIGNTPDTSLKKALRTALDTANNDLVKAEDHLKQWFNSTMDRVAGWYTRRTQVWLFFLGLGCAVVMNIDAITVMKSLSTDDKLRDSVLTVAGNVLASDAPDDTIDPGAIGASAAATDAPTPAELKTKFDNIKVAAAQMNEVAWPIGWSNGWRPTPQDRVFHAGLSKGADTDPGLAAWFYDNPLVILGWLVTAFGVTFGASFWFDVLNKFMVVRSTVKPSEKSPNEPSKS